MHSIGLRSKGLHRRFIPSATDAWFLLPNHCCCFDSKQETSSRRRPNWPHIAGHWSALQPFLTHLTPTARVVCAERRFRMPRKPTVLH